MIMSGRRNQGFTIVELMIATAVLSVLLLLASSIFLSIGNLYTKGVGGTRLQDNIRSIMQNVSGTVQFTSDPINPSGLWVPHPGVNEYAYCIGSQRYSYVQDTLPGTTIGSVTVQYVLWQDTLPATGGVCQPVDLTNVTASTPGKNIGLSNEAIHDFEINFGGSNLENITIDAYMAPGNDLTNLPQPPTSPVLCAGHIGDQFCTTAQLSTTIQRRLTSNDSQ